MRLAGANEDPVIAVIKLAAEQFIADALDVNRDLNTRGMQKEFDQLEGWPPQGAHGIRLLGWDGRPHVDSVYLDISEVEAPEGAL